MSNDGFATREEAFEASENLPTHQQLDRSIGNVIARRFSRRERSEDAEHHAAGV